MPLGQIIARRYEGSRLSGWGRLSILRLAGLSALLVFFLAACGGGGGGGDGGGGAPDTAAPTVSSTTPTGGAAGVFLDAAVVIIFSEAMDTAAVEGAFSMPPASGTYTWSLGNTVLTFTPGVNLSANTTYTVTIGTGATDAAGNPLASQYQFSFTTGTAISGGSSNWDQLVWDQDNWG